MNIAEISLLETVDNFLWGYAVLPLLILLGSYLTFKSQFVQFRRLPHIIKTFGLSFAKKHRGLGVHPVKVFFTCIGGCMGIGNVVAVCVATQIGGPGALFWVWITAIVGMIVKYSEVYLGMRYRVSDGKGGFRGGPMYFLRTVYKKTWIPKLACFLLCLYGVEIYQFTVITDIVSTNFEFDKYLVALVLILMIIAISSRGVHQVGRIASVVVPIFISSYLIMCFWVFIQNIHLLPAVFKLVVESAFTGHAAVGAFAGSTIILTASQGMRRSCYSGDLAVGYASVIHCETGEPCPEKQASLTILEVFLDSFIVCTTSVVLILVTDVWNDPVSATFLVQKALGGYFPAMHIYMPLFLLSLGFTTIISYFSAGIKCAEYLLPKIGRKVYYFYAFCTMFGFVFLSSSQALTVMSITAGLLLLLNLYGIFSLRSELTFHIPKKTLKNRLNKLPEI